MPTQTGLSPSVYNGGAVVFNNNKALNTYMQVIARRQAQEMALDNYYRDMFKQVNPAGMRNQDQDGYNSRFMQWRNFWDQHSDEIKNPSIDHGKAQSEFFGRYQDMQSYIDDSKLEQKKAQQATATGLQLQKEGALDFDTYHKAMQLHELPLDDPNRESIDITHFYTQKPLTPSELTGIKRNISSGLKQDMTQMGEPVPNADNSKLTYTFQHQYSDDSLKSAGQRARGFYQSSPAVKLEANKYLSSLLTNPDEFTKMNDVHEQYFGRPIANAEDAWAASNVAELASQKSTSTQVKDNWMLQENTRQANRMSIQQQQFTNNKKLAAFKKDLSNQDEFTTPNVSDIATALRTPATMINNKTAVQHAQDILSVFNSAGNNINRQSKLTALPILATPALRSVQGFDAVSSTAFNSLKNTYQALPDVDARKMDEFNKINSSSVPTSEKIKILADVYNKINQTYGSPVRFTPEDIRQSVPVLHEINDVMFEDTPEGKKPKNVKQFQVVKADSPEFSNVINEKRNAFLKNKKQVIASQEDTGLGEDGVEETHVGNAPPIQSKPTSGGKGKPDLNTFIIKHK